MKLRYKILNSFLALIGLAIIGLALTISYTEDCEPAAPLAEGVQTMKAVVYRCYGPPDVLTIEDLEKPVPGPDELLVRVHAASVNPYDWHFMRGSPYLMRLGSGIGAPSDIRIGADFAGTVEAVGSNVTRFEPGDEVFGGTSGAFGQYVTPKADRGIARKPAEVTFEQAASAPIAAVTALQALRDHGQLEPGQKVLINGSSGGVGTFAVQIAKAMGAEVYGVNSTRNVELVRSIGADHVFDYKKENYTESGVQFDLIIDMVGNHSLSDNRRVLKPDGRMVLVGGAKGNWIAPLIKPLAAMLQSPFVDQDVGMMIATMDGDDLATLADMMANGEVVPVLDRTFSLDEIADAVRYSEEGHARGKIIVTVP